MSDERVGPCGEHCAVVDECDERGREITRLRAENEKLRAALKPFAEAADDIPADNGSIGDGLCAPTVHKSAIFTAASVYRRMGNE